MFKNLLSSVKGMLQSDEKETAIKKLTEALNAAAADNSVTAEEMAELQKLQKELGISEEEFADAKIKLLDGLMDKINADGSISEEEIKLFNQLKLGLAVEMKMELGEDDSISKEDIVDGLSKMKGFLLKVKDKTVELGGKVVDKTKEMVAGDKKDEAPKTEETPKIEVK